MIGHLQLVNMIINTSENVNELFLSSVKNKILLMCDDAADSTQKENSELCVCLRFFSVTLCFFVSFWCACAERLSFSAVILHQSVAPLCLFVGFCVLGVIFNFVSFCVCLDSVYISHWFASFCLVCRPLLSFCVSFFTCLSLYVRHVSILWLFVFFVLILVNHSCCGSPCGQLLLIRLVSYHLCVSNSFAAPCCCFYVNRLFNLPAQLVIR